MTQHFNRDGAGYDRFRPTYPDDLGRELAQRVAQQGCVLDVGCGTGQLSLSLADHFDRVIACDLAEKQIQNATPHPKVTYHIAGATNLPAQKGEVDVVVAAQAAHWFDLPRFYDEVRRVVRPGGSLALVSYGVPYVEGSFNSIFQQVYWQELHRFWPPERAAVEKGYADLDFPFRESAFPSLFISQSLSISGLIGYMKTWSSYGIALKAGEAKVFEQAFDTLRKYWPEGRENLPFKWPLSVRFTQI